MTELSTNAKSLLDAAKRSPAAPSDEAIDRMEREVLLAVGLAATATATGAAVVKGASLWSAALGKILLGTTLLVVGGVVGAAIVWRPQPIASVPRTTPAILVAPTAPPPMVEPVPSITPPALPPPEPAPVLVEAPRPRAVKALSQAPTVEVQPPPIVVPAVPPSTREILPTTRELSVLRTALQHIDALEWTEGLAVLDRHDAEFPDGTLRDEADVLRVLALCGLEQVSAAFDLAVQVRARAPKSPALVRLSASCVSP